MGKRREVTVYKEISLELAFGAGNQTTQEIFLFKYFQMIKRLILRR